MTLRAANVDDIHSLLSLIEESAQALCQQDYTPKQISACIGTIFGVDPTLISDQTYYIAECDEQIVACGGWGKRSTPFGVSTAIPPLLNPNVDSARIRCFFVKPTYTGRGLASSILKQCEQDIINEGFKRIELTATLTGVKLYQRCGFVAKEQVTYKLTEELDIQFVKMEKMLSTV
jgi:N-acetylglutamate synthase-like GNAT family acetyltransferase